MYERGRTTSSEVSVVGVVKFDARLGHNDVFFVEPSGGNRDLDRRLHYRAPAVFMAAVATPISHLYGPLGGGARGGVAGLPSASIT